jgi:hypothetical protein
VTSEARGEMRRLYVRGEVVNSISSIRTTLQSSPGKTHEDCVLAEAKMMRSCALNAAPLDGLHHCGLALLMQTRHKEEMKIKERKSAISGITLQAEKLELAQL